MIARKVNDLAERNGLMISGRLRPHRPAPNLTTLHAELTELLDGAAQLANWLRSASDDGAVPIDVERTVQETSDAISEKCDKICLRMTTMQAHSIVELKFKIAAFAYLCPEDQEPHIELARSICDDIGQLQV